MSDDVSKSCRECPSFLEADKAVSKFKKSVGTPVCGRFGHVLGRPDGKQLQVDKLAKFYAKTCADYGKPMPPTPVTNSFKVCLPDIEAIDPDRLLARSQDDMNRCSTCATCVNFMRDEVVASEMGYTSGLCAATGRLILPNRQIYEARDCAYREYGKTRQSTQGMHLLPEYEDAFNLNVDPVKAYFKTKKEGVLDPQEYPTDKPVSEDDQAGGIRAWRKVSDPEGSGNEVYLPIYDKAHFSEPQWDKVPKSGDDEHPELYVDHNGAVYKVAVCWTVLDETPALWGEAGTGKTELFRHLAWMMCLPFERFSITGSTELDDLAGKMKYTPDVGTYFAYGRLPLAWQSACVVCLDEPNTGPPDVWQFLRPLTDNSKQLVLDQNTGERIVRHDDCYMGMAMNPAWDPRNVGAVSIGDADASRLLHIFMDLPPASLEKEIIRNRVTLDGWEIDDARLDTIMRIAKDIRDQCADQTLPITWGIRPQIKVARASRWFDMLTAYRMAVADYLEREAQEVLLDQVRGHLSS